MFIDGLRKTQTAWVHGFSVPKLLALSKHHNIRILTLMELFYIGKASCFQGIYSLEGVL